MKIWIKIQKETAVCLAAGVINQRSLKVFRESRIGPQIPQNFADKVPENLRQSAPSAVQTDFRYTLQGFSPDMVFITDAQTISRKRKHSEGADSVLKQWACVIHGCIQPHPDLLSAKATIWSWDFALILLAWGMLNRSADSSPARCLHGVAGGLPPGFSDHSSVRSRAGMRRRSSLPKKERNSPKTPCQYDYGYGFIARICDHYPQFLSSDSPISSSNDGAVFPS